MDLEQILTDESSPRLGTSPDALARGIVENLFFHQGRLPETASAKAWYTALAIALRHRVMSKWASSLESRRDPGVRQVAYLSAEFLLGPHAGSVIQALDLGDEVREACGLLGLDLDALLAEEPEPGLGNGGLGRLAACYLDSLAALDYPAMGYGIRYEHGIFVQSIEGGRQVELPDNWLSRGNPWEVRRAGLSYDVGFGGRTERVRDGRGRVHVQWVPDRVVKGVAHDTPIVGYKVETVNTLRLWRSESPESFDLDAFNKGDFDGSVASQVDSETISKVLYPNDEGDLGKVLRLKQQYFFTSCALQDMMRFHLRTGGNPASFHERYAIQLNDTHPAIAVAELLRLLVDVHGLEWDTAWDVTSRSFAFTNHTLLPEALETWPERFFSQLLPRHLEIIHEVNRRFLDEVRIRVHGDPGPIERLSIIEDRGERQIRMANLAAAASHTINGVSSLHSELLTERVMSDFHDLWPEKFTNVTNGVTPRRFLKLANPGLVDLIGSRIGNHWISDLERIREIEDHADDGAFGDEWQAVKRENKVRLARRIGRATSISVDPDSMFDVQVKRIHEYKRQHLNLLHIITLYNRVKLGTYAGPPRTVVFGGKAAPGYWMAKEIIEAIHAVARAVNRDPALRGILKVIFLPDFNVTSAQEVYPASDLSEQISTGGYEASGTGNMKFAMNGALTIGTLDGANVEIRERVGEENFFLFGLTADEVVERQASGRNPQDIVDADPELAAAMELLSSGFFAGGDPDWFGGLVKNLLTNDHFLVLDDYRAYVDCQAEVSRVYLDQAEWAKRSILNSARVGFFSSDRAIREYAERIWALPQHPPGSSLLD